MRNTTPEYQRRTRARILFLAVVALTTIIGASSALAGAWTQERGSLYSRASVNRYGCDQQFDDDGATGNLPLEGEFADLNFGGYLEYGLTSRLTAVTSFSLKSIRSENLVRIVESKGLSDIDLALRGRLLSGSAGVTALQLLAKIPSGYETDVALPIGNGETELEARALWGRSLWPLVPGYAGLELGYRWRDGDPADALRYLVELGGELRAGFYTRAKLDGTAGLGEDERFDLNGNPTVRKSFDLGILDLTLGGRFNPHIALEVGVAPALYGRTTTSGTTLTVAFAWAGSLGRQESPDHPTLETP